MVHIFWKWRHPKKYFFFASVKATLKVYLLSFNNPSLQHSLMKIGTIGLVSPMPTGKPVQALPAMARCTICRTTQLSMMFQLLAHLHHSPWMALTVWDINTPVETTCLTVAAVLLKTGSSCASLAVTEVNITICPLTISLNFIFSD